MSKLTKLNIRDTSGAITSFNVTDALAAKAQADFNRKQEAGVTKGTLQFTSLLFNGDRPVAEESMAIPLADIKAVGVVRAIRHSHTVTSARQRRGAFAALTAHMLANKQMLKRNARYDAEELADQFFVTPNTMRGYVSQIRSMYRNGELT